MSNNNNNNLFIMHPFTASAHYKSTVHQCYNYFLKCKIYRNQNYYSSIDNIYEDENTVSF